MSTDEPAIIVNGVHKSFKLPHEQHSGIKQAIVNFSKRKKGFENQHVLKGVSFEIKKGEFFGIVGRNGSGKSTLLKLLAGIYTPDKGHIQVNGSLTPFIELGVGFNPELTGRENVYMNGALLGFSNNQMDDMYDDIVNFAELERFMDQKLKNYSSGMQVRLAFSIAIRAKTDVLILDEVLAVGDEAFQRKCTEYFYKLKKEKKTVVLVTHSMDSVRSFCDRGLLLDKGEIIETGNPDVVAGRYSEIFQEEYIQAKQQENTDIEKNEHDGDVSVESIELIQNEKMTRVVDFLKDFSMQFNILSDDIYDDLTMGVHLKNESGQTITAITTKQFHDKLELHKGKNIYKFGVQNVLAEGNYSLDIAIRQKSSGKFLIQKRDIYSFAVVGVDASKYNPTSLVYPDITFSIEQ